jgi:hypothetical protein
MPSYHGESVVSEEVSTFTTRVQHSGGASLDVTLFRSCVVDSHAAHPPLFCVSDPDTDKRAVIHAAFELLFESLIRRNGGNTSTKLVVDAHADMPVRQLGLLQILELYLRDNLRAAFGLRGENSGGNEPVSFECYVEASEVSSGGFGADWHHDADSILTHNGKVRGQDNAT